MYDNNNNVIYNQLYVNPSLFFSPNIAVYSYMLLSGEVNKMR